MTFRVVGICGQAGSGKDVVADFFVEKGFAKVAFSDPMKRFVQYLFDLDNEQLWGSSAHRNQEFPLTEDEWSGILQRLEQDARDFVEELRIAHPAPAVFGLWDWLGILYTVGSFSPRIILQTLGTEWGRTLDPLLWVNYLHQIIVPRLKNGQRYVPQEGAFGKIEPAHAGVIIPDHRFANEIMATREQSGFMIRVSRPGRPQELKDPGVQNHPSEEEQKTLAPDFFHLELELPEGLENVRAVLEDLWQKAPWSHG